MAAVKPDDITFYDAELLPGQYKNFAGEEDQYNTNGDRYFNLILPSEECFQDMLEDGWNVKHTKPSKSDPEPELHIPVPFINVAVKFGKFPPDIFLITSKARTKMTEDMVEILDYTQPKVIDLIINSSRWTNSKGETGIKAYLKTMYFTVDENELELKYAIDPEEG